MPDSTTGQTSAESSLDAAASAWQDVLTPRQRPDTDEISQAQQVAEPKATQAAAADDDETADAAQASDAAGDEGQDGEQQGEAAQEEQGDESGSDSDGPDAQGDGIDLTQAFTVETGDGNEDVTLGELVKGYLRQKDYTRKTQAVADERRSVQAERAEAAQLRQQYVQGLGQLQEALKSMSAQEPDWDALRISNPNEYPQIWTDWQRHKAAVAQVEQEQKRVKDEQDRETAKQRAEMRKRGNEWLLQQVPEWKDAAKGQAERTEMQAFAAKLGYTPAELESVDDPRAILLLRQAMLYSKLQANKPLLIKPKAKTPVTAGTKTPVLKPKAVRAPQTRETERIAEAQKRHAKERSVQSAASYFETILKR